MELTFEEAMAKLKEITARMEGDQLPLKDLSALYQEGRKLYAYCKEQLDLTEKELITLTQENMNELR